MTQDEIRQKVNNYLTPERLRHSIGVMETAAVLAKRYNADVRKAEIAGLLHDIGRDLTLHEMIEICKKRTDVINEHIKTSRQLLHACAGRIIAEKEFGITDAEILNAIEKHTTGSGDMSLLDKIIFIADYIEPNRNFKGVKKARYLAFKNIDTVLLYIYKSVLIHLLRKSKYICVDTLNGYNSVISNLDLKTDD